MSDQKIVQSRLNLDVVCPYTPSYEEFRQVGQLSEIHRPVCWSASTEIVTVVAGNDLERFLPFGVMSRDPHAVCFALQSPPIRKQDPRDSATGTGCSVRGKEGNCRQPLIFTGVLEGEIADLFIG
jgi:hypothetical protein